MHIRRTYRTRMHTVNVVRKLEYSDVKDTLISTLKNITFKINSQYAQKSFSYRTKIIFTLHKLSILNMKIYDKYFKNK